MKNKESSKYVCSECGSINPVWLGKCPVCNKFGTLVEEIISTPTATTTKTVVATPKKLSEIEYKTYARTSSGLNEFDNVLGGGIVPSSIVLIGGDPGIGKSTILTQISGHLSKNNKVLYVSAEESLSQVKLRCDRLGIFSDNLMIVNECKLESIEILASDYDYIIVDSIQAIYLESLTGSAGSVGQVRECASRLMRLAKNNNKTIFIIGHVTKDGNIAGPKVLEHVMDTVLYFEGEPSDTYKILRAVKNRFGSAQEVGVFEMTEKGIKGITDYNGIFISETRGNQPGSIVTPSISGNRCMPVEIQSLLSKTVFGLPRRMPIGVDYNKLVLIIAILERKAYVPFFNQDVYLNAMSGIKLSEPSIDLAVALSLASSSKNIAIDKNVTAFGELGLSGEVRGVTFAEKRVADSIKYGFEKIIIPKRNYDACKKYSDKIEIIPVSYLSQALKYLFNDKPSEN